QSVVGHHRPGRSSEPGRRCRSRGQLCLPTRGPQTLRTDGGAGMSDLRVAFKLDAEAIDTNDAKRGKTPRSVVLRQAVVASVLGIESTPGGVVDRIGEIVDKIDWGEGYPYPTLEVEFTAFDNMLGIDRPAARYSRKGRWAPKAEATDAEVADA